MKYPYKCDDCQVVIDVIKPMRDAERHEKCPVCEKPMRRVYVPVPTTWGLGGWDFDKEGLGDNLILRHND